MYVLAGVPFIVITIFLFPLSSGVHGTVHADAGTDYSFDGARPDGSGDFTGDIYIADSTGWIFCNGNVRFWGSLNIEDADVHYTILEADHYGSMFTHDYLEITLEGDEGQMQEGVPFFLLGLFGTAFGVTVWLAWIYSRRSEEHDKAIILPSAGAGLFCAFNILFGYICLAALLVLVPITVLMLLSFAKYHSMETNNFVFAMVAVGVLVLVLSAVSLIHPNHYAGGGYEYNASAAVGSILTGTVGLISSGGMVGFGVGKVTPSRAP
ncbi:MAG: hypothetical protein KAW39_00550 [Thermoplasmata archaeon]|nr:hypothetical protein [Thermoplasmata archaeon]